MLIAVFVVTFTFTSVNSLSYKYRYDLKKIDKVIKKVRKQIRTVQVYGVAEKKDLAKAKKMLESLAEKANTSVKKDRDLKKRIKNHSYAYLNILISC